MVRSKLQLFSAQYPLADVFIESVFDDNPEAYVNIKSGTTSHVVIGYSRRRDAWRALRRAGYEQEGVFWRIKPKAEQPPVFDAVVEKMF